MAQIADSSHLVPVSEPEDLARPMDSGFQAQTDPPRTTISLAEGQETLTKLSVVHFEQQIGPAALKMGGIAGVETPSQHRMKGYARLLMLNSLRWMRSAGFDVTMLYGIRDFYPKFGYAQAFPNITCSLAVRDAQAVGARGYTMVEYGPQYLADTLRLYERCNAGRTGPTRRDARYWRPFRIGLNWGIRTLCKVLLDERKKVAGYLVHNGQYLEPTVLEIGYGKASLYPAILQFATQMAWDLRLENVRFSLPLDEPFLEFCKPLGMRQEVQCRRNGGGMVRMIHVGSSLRKTGGVLAGRMSSGGKLNLYTNLDNVGLSWSSGRLRVGRPIKGAPSARLPQWALAQMLYGYRDASALTLCGTLKAPRAVVETLDEMFPRSPHFHYAADNF